MSLSNGIGLWNSVKLVEIVENLLIHLHNHHSRHSHRESHSTNPTQSLQHNKILISFDPRMQFSTIIAGFNGRGTITPNIIPPSLTPGSPIRIESQRIVVRAKECLCTLWWIDQGVGKKMSRLGAPPSSQFPFSLVCVALTHFLVPSLLF